MEIFETGKKLLGQVAHVDSVYNHLGKKAFNEAYPTFGKIRSDLGSRTLTGAIAGGAIGFIQNSQDGVDLGSIFNGALTGSAVGAGFGAFRGYRTKQTYAKAFGDELSGISKLAKDIAEGRLQ